MRERLHRIRRRVDLWVWYKLRRSQRWLRYHVRFVRRLERDSFPELVPRPDPLFPRLQIGASRAAGRVYERLERIRERERIQRARLPDRTSGLRLGRELVRLQRGLLGTLTLLVVLGTAGDVLLGHYGERLAGWIPYEPFFREHLDAPTGATLTLVLTATAAATGTILGLVLTISLIVFQTTASRYDSDRIVAFLLRERVGSFVIRLIGLAFLLSLWVLALRNVIDGYQPYVSAAIALALGTTGAASLIPYRSHALAAYLPAQIFASLARELRYEVGRIAARRRGRSVEAHARRVAVDDLGTIDDLLRGLVARSDWRGVTSGIDELRGFLTLHLQAKRFLPDRSEWFERVPVRLGTEAFEITQHIARRGLLPPADVRPDQDWVETTIVRSLAMIDRSRAVESREVVESLLMTYGHALQLAWRGQDFAVVDLVLERVDELGRRDEIVLEHAQRYFEVLWALVYDVTDGLTSSPEAIVAAEPWKLEPGTARLPRLAREQADLLGRKVRKEIAVTGFIVTPREVMASEIARVWDPLEEEKRASYLARAFALAQHHLHLVTERRALAGAQPAAEMILRLILMAFDRGGRPVIDVTQLSRDIYAAYELTPTSEGRRQLRDDSLYTAIRVLAERQEWSLAIALLRVAALVATSDLNASPGPTDEQRLVISYEFLFHCAYLYGWGEFFSHDVAPMLAPIMARFFNLGELIKLYGEEDRPSQLPIEFQASVRYITWFQPLSLAIHDLPDRWVQEGYGYGPAGKEHPSPLFRRWFDFTGHDEMIGHLIVRVTGDLTRRQILALIDERIRRLGAAEAQ